MKRLVIALLVLLASSMTALADKPTGKIIDRYRKASGGKTAFRVKSTVLVGTVKNSDGVKGAFSYQAFAPNNLRIDMDLAGAKISECYNGKSAWRLDARGLRTLLGDDAKRLRLESLLSNTRLSDLQRNRIVPQLSGKANINDSDANSIDFI
jgi:hypothetical protein